MQIYFKDKFIDETEAHIGLNDRSFRFGDGVFETAIIFGGKVWDWPRHAKRLGNGLKFYKLDIDISKVPQITTELIKKNKVEQGYLRLIISRGTAPGVGYMHDNSKPYMIVQVMEKPLPEYKTITLVVASLRAYYRTPCKTNNAMLYSRAMMEADAAKCDNALILSHENYICETSNANIFWIKGNVLYTPSTDLPFVPGTIREKTLELWTGTKTEGRFTVDDLKDADEIFMTNIGGIVTTIGEIKPLGIRGKSSEKTEKLRRILVKGITTS